jgi:hypothetical protein
VLRCGARMDAHTHTLPSPLTGRGSPDGLTQPELNHDPIPNHGRDGRASSATSSRSHCDKSTCYPEQASGLDFPFQSHLRVENPTAGE